jgi:hypothetical protein
MQKILLFLAITGATSITFFEVFKITDEKINKLREENELILKNNKMLDSVRATYKIEIDQKNQEIEKLQEADQILLSHVKTIDTKIKSLNTSYEKANNYSNNFGSEQIRIYFSDSLR